MQPFSDCQRSPCGSIVGRIRCSTSCSSFQPEHGQAFRVCYCFSLVQSSVPRWLYLRCKSCLPGHTSLSSQACAPRPPRSPTNSRSLPAGRSPHSSDYCQYDLVWNCVVLAASTFVMMGTSLIDLLRPGCATSWRRNNCAPPLLF